MTGVELSLAMLILVGFEAILSAARQSPNQYDFALVAILGLLGLWIFEVTSANISDWPRNTSTPMLPVARQGRQSHADAACHQRSGEH